MATNIHVILARDVANLGHLGEVVKVKPGYARNFLFPLQFALPVSPERLKQFEHQKRLINHKRLKLQTHSEEVKRQLATMQITIPAKVGEQGKLFGSIGTRDIEKAMKEQGHTVSHRDIKLENPIKTIGLHQIEVRLEGDVRAMINVVIVSAVEETAPVVVVAEEEVLA
jgi:large subunit ribosomal protein L9